MSRSQRRRTISSWAVLTRLLVAGCATLTLLVGGFFQNATVRAQDGSPVAAECDAPDLPPGTPTPQMDGSPEAETDASPAAEPAGAEEDEATPEGGAPADEATTQEAVAAVENLVNCLNSGDYEGVVALFTENFLQSEFGTTNPYDAVVGLEGLTFQDFEIGDVTTYPDGRLAVEVAYLESEYQYVHERWWLVQDGEYWKLDGFDTLRPEPEGDTAVVGVALGSPEDEYALVPNAEAVTQSEVLILHAQNKGQEPHMLAVLKLPEGVTLEQVMQDPTLEDQVEFIGALDYLEPGQEQDLALVDLPPGEYTLACFFDAPDGKTHLEHGMVATITVNAPA
ncbi:MAG: hypothetical protein QOF73_1056 [Thermomicrobiales bacterium]|nr:hypothetical protein [Thermomicrobiales bacterium]